MTISCSGSRTSLRAAEKDARKFFIAEGIASDLKYHPDKVFLAAETDEVHDCF